MTGRALNPVGPSGSVRRGKKLGKIHGRGRPDVA
jgi:hypothetical protein